MEKSSITNCFINYKKKHIITTKHLANLERRKQRGVARDTPNRGPAQVIVHGDKVILDQHVEIKNSLNASQGREEATFEIKGDLNREPLLLAMFRVRCMFCFTLF